MARRQTANSPERQIQKSIDSRTVLPLPDGVTLDSEEEEILWRQFTSARAHDDWREIDLVLLCDSIKLEIKIRKNTAEMGDDFLIDGKENPLLKIIDQLEKRKLSIFRLLAMGVKSNKGATLNSGGHRTSTISDKGIMSLLA